jgi:transposase
MGNREQSCGHEQELKALRRENQQLKARVAELEARIQSQDRAIEELKRQLQEAVQAQKRQAAPFSKGPPKENPKTPGRKAGAAYGVHAHRMPPEEVDEIIHVKLPKCCAGCGGTKIKRLPEMAQQFQEEMPRKPIRRRFDIELGECLDCGQRVHGRHEWQTSDATGAAAAQLGPDAQAMVASLKDEIGLSHGKICKVMDRAFQMQVTVGGVAQILLRVAQRIKAAYGGIAIVVRRSRQVEADETSWKVAGKLQWLWTFVVRTATQFIVRPSRGFDVLEEVLGAEYPGTIGHDGFSPYDKLERALHQQCWRHIGGRCEDMVEDAGGPLAAGGRLPTKVLQVYHDALALRDRRDSRKISRHGLAVAVGRIYGRMYDLVIAPRTWKNDENRKLMRHLGIHFDQLFTFLEHPGVEPTAWRVDQGSRFAIVNRKVFGGNRYETGARAMERICSVGATCVKRGLDFFTYLGRVLCAPEDKRDRLACRLLRLPLPDPA